MTLDSLIEAILFAAARPLRLKYLAEVTHTPLDLVRDAITTLRQRLDETQSGIMLQQQSQEVELVTRPEAAASVASVTHAETQGELTRAGLEALSILAYCGPLTRPELEQIRGVQSALILRNLMLRGLIEQADEEHLGQATYAVTFQFLNHLGLPDVEALPEYTELRGRGATAQDMQALRQTD